MVPWGLLDDSHLSFFNVFFGVHGFSLSRLLEVVDIVEEASTLLAANSGKDGSIPIVVSR